MRIFSKERKERHGGLAQKLVSNWELFLQLPSQFSRSAAARLLLLLLLLLLTEGFILLRFCTSAAFHLSVLASLHGNMHTQSQAVVGVSLSIHSMWDGHGEGSSEYYRLIGEPPCSLDNHEFYLHNPGYENYRHRQLYLHSYKFTRKETLKDKLMSSLSKFRAAAWAVLACNLRPQSSIWRHSLKSSACIPLPLPKCLQVSS